MYSRLFANRILKGDLSQASKAGRALGGALLVGAAVTSTVLASDEPLFPASYPFGTSVDNFKSLDHASLRRGFEVYRQVCSTCHSLNRIRYRHMVGVTHTTAQLKAIAKDRDIVDGPDEKGDMFERPRELKDPIGGPYRNEEEARMANNGALPIDLSLAAKARAGGENYIFALLTGYSDPPAGHTIMDGLHYNPYFRGGNIAMAPPLSYGQTDYEDDTEATISQQAKDVSHFLTWCASPEYDERRLLGVQVMGIWIMMAVSTGLLKRYRWNSGRTARISFPN